MYMYIELTETLIPASPPLNKICLLLSRSSSLHHSWLNADIYRKFNRVLLHSINYLKLLQNGLLCPEGGEIDNLRTGNVLFNMYQTSSNCIPDVMLTPLLLMHILVIGLALETLATSRKQAKMNLTLKTE